MNYNIKFTPLFVLGYYKEFFQHMNILNTLECSFRMKKRTIKSIILVLCSKTEIVDPFFGLSG